MVRNPNNKIHLSQDDEQNILLGFFLDCAWLDVLALKIIEIKEGRK